MHGACGFGMIKADDLLSGQPRTVKESGLLACYPIRTTALEADICYLITNVKC